MFKTVNLLNILVYMMIFFRILKYKVQKNIIYNIDVYSYFWSIECILAK